MCLHLERENKAAKTNKEDKQTARKEKKIESMINGKKK